MKNQKYYSMTASAVVAALLAVPAQAAVIDFETLPGGGIPTDDAPLSMVDWYTDGATQVRFGIDSNGLTGGLAIDAPMYFETFLNETGPGAINGYESNPPDGTNFDRDDSIGAVGKDFFLAPPPATISGKSVRALPSNSVFLVEYNQSMTLPNQASGQIWDNDNGEVVTVTAYRTDFTTIGSPQVFDGSAAKDSDFKTFSFSFGEPIAFIGITATPGSGAGPLGFDNFNATAISNPVIPETSSLAVGFALLGMAFLRRRTR